MCVALVNGVECKPAIQNRTQGLRKGNLLRELPRK